MNAQKLQAYCCGHLFDAPAACRVCDNRFDAEGIGVQPPVAELAEKADRATCRYCGRPADGEIFFAFVGVFGVCAKCRTKRTGG